MTTSTTDDRIKHLILSAIHRTKANWPSDHHERRLVCSPISNGESTTAVAIGLAGSPPKGLAIVPLDAEWPTDSAIVALDTDFRPHRITGLQAQQLRIWTHEWIAAHGLAAGSTGTSAP